MSETNNRTGSENTETDIKICQSHMKGQRLIMESLKKLRTPVLSLQENANRKSYLQRYRLSRIKAMLEVNQLRNFFAHQFASLIGTDVWRHIRKFVHQLEMFDPEISSDWINLLHEATDAIVKSEKAQVNILSDAKLSVEFLESCCELYTELQPIAEIDADNELVPVGDAKVVMGDKFCEC